MMDYKRLLSITLAMFFLGVTTISPAAAQGLPNDIATLWSADGSTLAYLKDGSLTVVDVVSGQTTALPSDFPADVIGIDWHPAVPQLAVGTQSGDVSIWQFKSEENPERLTTLNFGVNADTDGILRGVWEVSWSYTGDYLAAAGAPGGISLRIWEAASYRLIFSAALGADAGGTWHPTNNTLVVTSVAGVRLLDVDTLDKAQPLELNFPTWVANTPPIGVQITKQSISFTAWNEAGTQLAAADLFGSVWMIDPATRDVSLFIDLLDIPPTADSFFVTSLAWHDQQLCGGVQVRDVDEVNKTDFVSSEVRCWDVATKAVLQTFESDATYLRAIDLQGGKLVFGDVASNTRSTNLIESGAVQIVDLAQ